jgi:hypothetical protein
MKGEPEMHLLKRPHSYGLVLVAVAAALATVGAIRSASTAGSKLSLACPAGYVTEKEGQQASGPCVPAKHPEPVFENVLRQEWLESVRSAPYDHVAPGAYSNAVAERQALVKANKQVKGTEGKWQPYGHGPLIVNDPAYTSVNGLGFVNNMGRIDDLAFDQAHNRLFAVLGTGGIWLSENQGDSWRSIGDSLPSQIVGAVAWTSAAGGTLIALSGDPTFGGGGYTGYGAFYSTNLGGTWSKATGIPDGALGFSVDVNPLNPSIVYAATLFGLFRSTDGGKSYVNVNLPTGQVAPGVDCTGVAGGGKCQLANVVTDVAIKAPGGVNADVPAGTVTAIVGWRASNRKNVDGSTQSVGNGVYRSDTGAPGTFAKVSTTGWPAQDRQGRVELGAAVGPQQDHDYLYAIVQDAAALNGQLDVLDVPVPDPTNAVRPGTVLNGIYVSSDFGKTWTLMADDDVIAKDPASGSALIGYGQAVGYEPGIQAWYNEWIAPDPTRQTLLGIPTRLAFGLEEIWQNELPVPLNGPTKFKVIGRYYSGETCSFLSPGLPECPTNRPPTTSTTTHPDQQTGAWITDATGGVTLAAGNDGGFFRNHVGAGQELDNGGWGDGNQTGFNTLLPYSIAIANDGTAWAGLQDNGHMKIAPDGRQYETFGGDGTFAAVDPANSKIAYEAYTYNDMKVTTDGGQSWRGIDPGLTNTRFVNPFKMDPTNARHLVTAGNEVAETTFGPDTQTSADKEWSVVYDLGTAQHPGQASATASSTDPANQMSAIDVRGDAVYVGFCGVCDILNATAVFKRGLATNVGGALPPKQMSSDGWHIATAAGLPNRFITSVTVDPKDPRTVYVALGGYSRRWVPPGSLWDANADVGVGHVFVSHDAGESFTDISGNLPDVPAAWVVIRGTSQVIVGTDTGVYATALTGGTTYAPLTGLPVVPISMLALKPNDPNLLFAATYGRSVWTYQFKKLIGGTTDTGGGTVSKPPAPTGVTLAGPYGFETDAQGWTVQSNSANGLNLTQWKRGAPGSTSATSFQVTPYTDESTTSFISPQLTSAGGWVYVDFLRKQDSEPGFDFLNVEWSSDGQVWNAASWLKDPAISDWSDSRTFSGTNEDYPAFTHETAAFQAPAGALQVRFRFASDQLVSSPLYQGVWIDDVVVQR